MAFTPVQFTKFGKNASDLFKKQFDFRNEVTSTTKTSNGVTNEVNVVANGKTLDAKVKTTYKSGKVDTELNLNTKGDVAFKGVVPYKVHDNLKLTVSANGKKEAKLDAEFAQDGFVGTAAAEFKGGNTILNSSLVIGSEGLSVGGAARAEVSKDGAFAVQDYNLGLNYSESDFTAALSTKKNGTQVAASYFQKVNGTQSVAALYDYNMDKDTSAITVGTALKLDNATNFKVKANTAGQVCTALQHTVANPNVRVNLSAQFDARTFAFNAEKFGVGLKFGQF